MKDNKDGTYDVSYMPPPEKSDCNVKVTYANQDIPGSPFRMKVRPTCEPQNVKLVGLGGKPVPASLPHEFTIDAREAGVGEAEVVVKVRASSWPSSRPFFNARPNPVPPEFDH